MIANLPTYDEARKAIRGGKNPMAFLHLGIIYAEGIGITQNHVLANYFFRKALDLGCQEAETYLNMEYEAETKDFAAEIDAVIEFSLCVTPDLIDRLKKRVEKERVAGNYGNLSKIRKHLQLFYPSYNKEKAISDILNCHNTIDADILYSLCTINNASEKYINSQESILNQLHAPILKHNNLWEYINTDVLSKDERELIENFENIVSSYNNICHKYEVDRKVICPLEPLDLYPYIKISPLVQLRKQVFRCLLSIKDIDPNIRDKYLECLDSDDNMLQICVEIKDEDIQLFLISFVAINLCIETLETVSLSLLRAYRNNNLQPLADHLNDCVGRLTKLGIKHSFPQFSTENLPPINF